MKNDFDNRSFRDFDYITGMDAWARARMFQAYLTDQTAKGQLNYRLVTTTCCGPIAEMNGSNPYSQRALLQKLLRELAVNTAKRQPAWNNKEQFITLWFISAGRFPKLSATPIADWVARQLPFTWMRMNFKY